MYGHPDLLWRRAFTRRDILVAFAFSEWLRLCAIKDAQPTLDDVYAMVGIEPYGRRPR